MEEGDRELTVLESTRVLRLWCEYPLLPQLLLQELPQYRGLAAAALLLLVQLEVAS